MEVQMRPLGIKEEKQEEEARVAYHNKEKLMESTRKEMGEVREENERLKKVLTRIMEDYESLQRQLFNIKQEDANKKSMTSLYNQASISPSTTYKVEGEEVEFVSLSLGTSSSKGVKRKDQPKHEMNETTNCMTNQGLTLALSGPTYKTQTIDCSPDGSLEQHDVGITNHKDMDVVKYKDNDKDEEALQHHVQVKRARVSIRTRCDTPTMNDGCQWRKYGQKISKGNPCPRAYYRCTMAPACPVRKQVQRCAEDMSILTTTYEGTHNHPLPMAATTIASTTSAAATMILSGATSMSHPVGITTPQSMTAGLSFSSFSQRFSHNPYYNMDQSTLSTSLMPPTITLDLTDPSSFSSYMYNKSLVASNLLSSSASTTESTSELQSSWRSRNGTNYGYLNYFGKNQLPYERNSTHGPMGLQIQPEEVTSLKKPLSTLNEKDPFKNENVTPALSTDILAKVITSDPRFQAAMLATISSMTRPKIADQGIYEAMNHISMQGSTSSLCLQSSPVGLSIPSNNNSLLAPHTRNGGPMLK